MHIENFKINNEYIFIKFDTSFKSISYIKMECVDKDTTLLDSEQIQIKFSKSRDWLDISIKNHTFIVLLINQIDNIDCLFSYYITNDNTIDDTTTQITNQSTNSLNMGSSLLKLKTNDNECKPEIQIVSIKNENIFATLKKKV